MATVLRIGTRGSRLAIAQAESVASVLRQVWGGLDVRIEVIRTTGDRDRATPLARMPGVGVFVKELEAALLNGRIDLAVHSMKDVPTRVPEGLEVEASVPRRADVRECLVSPGGLSLADLPAGALVGSGSSRRRAMLRAVRPDLEFTDLRGNVETRLRKLEEGVVQATVLARAGLERLGIMDRRMVTQELDVMTPAAGQGAIGLEFRSDDGRVRELVAAIDHPPTRWAVVAERALVRCLGAGCQTPLGVLGRVDYRGRLVLDAYLLSADGSDRLRRRRAGQARDASDIGSRLAETLIEEGAGRFIGTPADRSDDGVADA